jgi:hypothetical protein
MIQIGNRRNLIGLAAMSLMLTGCFSYTKRTTVPAPAVAVEPVPAASETTTTTTTDDNGIVQKHSSTTYTSP